MFKYPKILYVTIKYDFDNLITRTFKNKNNK